MCLDPFKAKNLWHNPIPLTKGKNGNQKQPWSRGLARMSFGNTSSLEGWHGTMTHGLLRQRRCHLDHPHEDIPALDKTARVRADRRRGYRIWWPLELGWLRPPRRGGGVGKRKVQSFWQRQERKRGGPFGHQRQRGWGWWMKRRGKNLKKNNGRKCWPKPRRQGASANQLKLKKEAALESAEKAKRMMTKAGKKDAGDLFSKLNKKMELVKLVLAKKERSQKPLGGSSCLVERSERWSKGAEPASKQSWL